jgi:hypothetical protein
LGAVAFALPFFALTLFVSAFLLFLVQPIIGKLILPSLGGTPQVWNTCMVFFQTALLAGYAYTHFVSTRLKVKAQLLVHGVILLLPLVLLYVISSIYYGDIAFFYSAIKDFKPISGGNPIFAALFLLLWVVGLPFIVVATSAPLLQKWFGQTGHPAAKDPYFLYGASNLGSFLSLIAYPLILERLLPLDTQSWIWTVGYTLLVILVFGCVALVLAAPRQVTLAREKPAVEPVKERVVVEQKEEVGVKAGAPPGERASAFKKGAKQFKKGGQKEARPRLTERREEHAAHVAPSIARVDRDPRLSPVTPLRRLRWVALAAIPSSLMLGVTTYATTDLSPIPLLWLIPLMLYLLSFILVFARWPVVWVEKPHQIFVIAQPFFIAALVFMLVMGRMTHSLFIPILIHMAAFFVTTMVCHGELAKDRPATEHLTEFYLLMSVGGMLGGIFNGLIAPILFIYVMEYGLAIFFSAMLRPQMGEVSWMDQYLEGLFGGAKGRGGHDRAGAPAEIPLILDIALPILVFLLVALLVFLLNAPLEALFRTVFSITSQGGGIVPFLLFTFGIGLLCSILFMERPLRYGLTIGGLLVIYALYTPQRGGGETIHRDRSYFGVIVVKKMDSRAYTGGPDLGYFTNMIHGTTDHGMNFRDPKYSRLATTYYHRFGPAGRVMELFNWFPGKQNTYYADLRMPATIIGSGATPLNFTGFPAEQMLALWSEPPYATIGLGTGTMASYARAFQHMHYYEIDRQVVLLSIPGDRGPFYDRDTQDPLFTYLRDAKGDPKYFNDRNFLSDPKNLSDPRLGRGAELWIFMGDARLRMAQPFTTKDDYSDWTPEICNKYRDNRYNIMVVDGDIGGGPDNFYHMMVVDAFSSDAIPVHLITKEAIAMYMTKLTKDGILCVHTSNKYVNLVPVVADVASSLGLKAYRAHDESPDKLVPGSTTPEDAVGHYNSEWVMVVRNADDFKRGTDNEKNLFKQNYITKEYPEKLRAHYAKQPGVNVADVTFEYWTTAKQSQWPPWTDNYSNVISAIRWPGSRD